MALNVVSSDRLSTNVKTSNLATGLSSKVGESKNIIINGAMNVAQRGTSSTSTGYKTVDRFKLDTGGTDEAVTQAQHALTSSDTGPWAKGFRSSYHLTNGNQTGGAGAADWVEIQYNVEARDLANSGWDYTSTSSDITISFWAQASVAQTYYVYLQTTDGTAQTYSFSFALSANTWTKVTKTIPGAANVAIDNNNGNGLRIGIVPFYGTDYTTSGFTLNTWAAHTSSNMLPDNTSTWYTTNDATFEITGLQLEVGDTATEFEHSSYADDLIRCLRYCYCACAKPNDPVAIGAASSADYALFTVRFPVPMRAEPSMEAVSGGSGVEQWELMPPGNSSAYFAALNGTGRASLTAFNVRANISSNFTAKQAYFLNNANAGGTDAVPKGLIFNAEF